MSSNVEFCISAQTEAEGPGAERRRQTELEEAVRWKGLPQGEEGDERRRRTLLEKRWSFNVEFLSVFMREEFISFLKVLM